MSTIRWLLSWLALFLAFAVSVAYLLIESFFYDELRSATADPDQPWSLGLATVRLALMVIPNLIAVLIVYTFVARVLRERGLDSASDLAESIRSEIEDMVDTSHAPLEPFLDHADPARFSWDEDFLAKARAATLVCRFAEDFFEHWYPEFLSFLNGGGRLILVLPNPYRADLLSAMDTQREDMNVADRVRRTLDLVDQLSEDAVQGQPVSVYYIDKIVSYDIYLAPNALAIRAPYENHYRTGNRPPVSIARPPSPLYQFLSDEVGAIIERCSNRVDVDEAVAQGTGSDESEDI